MYMAHVKNTTENFWTIKPPQTYCPKVSVKYRRVILSATESFIIALILTLCTLHLKLYCFCFFFFFLLNKESEKNILFLKAFLKMRERGRSRSTCSLKTIRWFEQIRVSKNWHACLSPSSSISQVAQFLRLHSLHPDIQV